LQTFESLGLNENIVKALQDLNISSPTPIQEQAIPMLLNEATDFLGLAQTGTGKTAAFGIPLIEHIDVDIHAVQAVVLSPTRELAQQIAQQLKHFSKYLSKIEVGVVYGGAAITNQIKDLKRMRPQILVATPGRMIDLIDRKVLNLSNVRFAVLDEADEMLNMGFKEDIDTILSFTQHDKNTWLFSATMPPDIRNIVHKYMKDPLEVSIISQDKLNTNIKHQFALVKRFDKEAAIQRIIDAEGGYMYCLIFCRTKAETQRLSTSMGESGYAVEAIHGDLSQQQRNTVMRKFKSKQVKILAATDVAARGIDVNDLTHVIHYDLPDDLAFYTHRSGRTGRAGKTGVAISLVSPAEQRKLFSIERQLKTKFEKIMVPSADEVKLKSVQSKLDELLSVEETDEAKVWVHAFIEQLEFLSKEDIIAKFITGVMEKARVEKGGDLNASSSSSRDDRGDRGRRNDRGGRSDRSDRGRPNVRERRSERTKDFDKPFNKRVDGKEENMKTFEINLGKGDELNKGDLLKIICDTTGIRSKHIGRIDIFGDKAKFDIEITKADSVQPAFKGLRFKGRSIKVDPKG
jgi:ATP-dependent RNA helicase DeaD